MDTSDPPDLNLTEPPLALTHNTDASVVLSEEGANHSEKNGKSGDRDKSFRYALKAAIIAMVVNLVIAALKLGTHFGISRSPALFSEGLHSFGDALNSMILLVGIIRGSKMADRTHPFGYGLETNLWALLASVMLLFSATWATWEGVQHLLHPTHDMTDYTVALVVLGLSIVFEVYAVWTASKAILAELDIESTMTSAIPLAFKHFSRAKVPTTRYVFQEDMMAFLGAALAFAVLWVKQQGPYFLGLPTEQLDAIASLIIGLMLFGLAISLFMHNRGVLVGSAAPAQVEKGITDLVLGMHGVSHMHDLKTIDQGHSGMIINMVVEVEPDTPVKDVDDLTERIKDKLSQRFQHVHQDSVFIEVLADETEDVWDKRFETLVEQGLRQEVLRPRDAILVRQAYEFRELSLKDVMVPRTDVTYVYLDTPLWEMAEKMLNVGHTRWPVVNENLDDLVGIVHARDVFRQIYEGKMDTPLKTLIREIDLYPPNKLVSDLLEEFKKDQLQMAAVADEHGGFAGIVTIEDLMEEIVGEIWDEHEEEDLLVERLDPTHLKVSGKYNTEDLNEEHGFNFPTEEFVTIGGFVFGQLGREPEPGDVVVFEDVTLKVDAVDGARILDVVITHVSAPLTSQATETP